jgi:cation diffusion facilitator CzcD-associated flavoprotein CzcO
MVNIREIIFSLLALPSSWQPHSPEPVHVVPCKSIAIIGAGSAGLAALKTFLDLPEDTRHDWNIALYEQRRDVGGIW